MERMGNAGGSTSQRAAVLFGLLAAMLWAAVLFLSVRAIASVAHDLEVVRTSDSYAGRTFTVSYDDLVYTQLGFGAEGASDEELAREEVLSYFEDCASSICERAFSTMVFYLLMLGTVIGATVYHATHDAKGSFVSRFAAVLVAVYLAHAAVLAGSFIVNGMPIMFERPACAVFIVVSCVSAIAGSAVIAAILARFRFNVLAVISAPAILHLAFSLDILFCADLLQALVEGARLPLGGLAYELLVPLSGSGISIASQILIEEGFAVPVWCASPYAIKALVWFAIALILCRTSLRGSSS